ncbi:hypothetical protein KYK29_15685 [Shinella daejeonensis]|uniref:TubC N-terminal docking domain-related protein n=1 Tax=Shinella daejeonensis TaxID=659017 RepID=UPI0020C750FD|nr:hypothetical protein [Shinella daejeonensis]MCP8896369.1 hypothetical protein [Shinella daejeonensis]
MSAAVDLVKALASDGVEFSTDGERIRWRNGDGKVTPEIVAALAAEKGTVIDFLTGKAAEDAPAKSANLEDMKRDLRRDLKLDPVARPNDADRYADTLRLHGPMTYGMAMRVLRWGGTRAAQAEASLQDAGRITFNKLGRAVLVEDGDVQCGTPSPNREA